MIQNKEQLHRIFEIEERLSEGDLTLEEMFPYEQEQKSIIIDQYYVYREFMMNKLKEYEDKYGEICNHDFMQYPLGIFFDKDLNLWEDSNLYIYSAAKYDDGRWSKPRFDLSNTYDFDIRLTFEEIFDLDKAEHKLNKYLIEESYRYKEELQRQYAKLKQLEDVVENSDKLSANLQCKNVFWDIDYSYSDKPINYYEDLK